MIDLRYTRWFKRVRLALKLSRTDIVDVMSYGGVTVTKSRADGWMRSEDDVRRATMTEDEFDAFTSGLAEQSVCGD